MKNEFLNCVALMMNSTRYVIEKELDMINTKIADNDDYGAESYIVNYSNTR